MVKFHFRNLGFWTLSIAYWPIVCLAIRKPYSFLTFCSQLYTDFLFLIFRFILSFFPLTISKSLIASVLSTYQSLKCANGLYSTQYEFSCWIQRFVMPSSGCFAYILCHIFRDLLLSKIVLILCSSKHSSLHEFSWKSIKLNNW